MALSLLPSGATSQAFNAFTAAPGAGRPQFSGSQLPGSQFSGSQFTGPSFSGSQFPSSQFSSSRVFSGAQFSGSGTLLKDHCATAQYTLIDYGPTASYVPFIGCMDSQPECCPFTPVTATTPPATPSVTVQGIPVTTPAVYPQPKNAKDAIVNSCPADYHSISGSCCPNSYTPWTTDLGGETPCYSTLPVSTTAGPAADKIVAPRDTKPTVTVTATVFAMQYAVLNNGNKLSAGAIAGIVVGWAVFAGAVGWGFRLYRRRRRRAEDLERLKEDLKGAIGWEPGSSVVPTSLGAGGNLPPRTNPDLPGFAPNFGGVHLYGGRPRALDPIAEPSQPSGQISEPPTTVGDAPYIRVVPKPVQSSSIRRTPTATNGQDPNVPVPFSTRRLTSPGQRPNARRPSAASALSFSRTPVEYYPPPSPPILPAWLPPALIAYEAQFDAEPNPKPPTPPKPKRPRPKAIMVKKASSAAPKRAPSFWSWEDEDPTSEDPAPATSHRVCQPPPPPPAAAAVAESSGQAESSRQAENRSWPLPEGPAPAPAPDLPPVVEKHRSILDRPRAAYRF